MDGLARREVGRSRFRQENQSRAQHPYLGVPVIDSPTNLAALAKKRRTQDALFRQGVRNAEAAGLLNKPVALEAGEVVGMAAPVAVPAAPAAAQLPASAVSIEASGSVTHTDLTAIRSPSPTPTTVSGSVPGSIAGSIAGSVAGSVAGSDVGMSPYASGNFSPYQVFDPAADNGLSAGFPSLDFGMDNQYGTPADFVSVQGTDQSMVDAPTQ
ncbi:hypothetical protein K438DRAFT_2177460 [Mycena galopus ATCC 62051]|nr:hypothetical protein K438DRAFT_2177460 [Mycena galopus ATCC 62051]